MTSTQSLRKRFHAAIAACDAAELTMLVAAHPAHSKLLHRNLVGYFIERAIENKWQSGVEILWGLNPDPDDRPGFVRAAAAESHWELVEWLLPLCTCVPNHSNDVGCFDLETAARRAVEQNQPRIVQLLLDAGVDAQARSSELLQLASVHRAQETFNMLCPLSVPEAALACMQKHNPDKGKTALLQAHVERLRAEQQNAVLSRHMSHQDMPPTPLKKM